MTQFIQLHLLTSYPPSNLNRDDLGRPKTAQMGGVNRLRISSQSLKRAWRTSEAFRLALGETPIRQDMNDKVIGTRSKILGLELFKQLADLNEINLDALSHFKDKNGNVKLAYESARAIAEQFGKLDGEFPPKKKKKGESNGDEPTNEEDNSDEDETTKQLKTFRKALSISQLFHISPGELSKVMALIEKLKKERRAPNKEELNLLREDHHAVDIALFGRMLAEQPRYNTEAAVQVAHAITVHPVSIQDDYFTAVDDLNKGLEDKGSAHIGEAAFGAGIFYLYICINRDLLDKNLGNEQGLRNKTLTALLEAVTKISPTGKQNSFASRAYASYVLAEKGDKQPRSLSLAFLTPVSDEDYMKTAIERVEEKRESMDKMYGPCADDFKVMKEGNGVNLNDITKFIIE